MSFRETNPQPALSGQQKNEADNKVVDCAGLHLALLHDLESSLERSRQAVIALDLAAIHAGTREQIGLSRKLQDVIARATRVPRSSPELVLSRHRVLQAVRVQAALLARAQRKLQVLGNVMAGPARDYASFLEASGRREAASSRRREEPA